MNRLFAFIISIFIFYFLFLCDREHPDFTGKDFKAANLVSFQVHNYLREIRAFDSYVLAEFLSFYPFKDSKYYNAAAKQQ